ncbi:ArpU family phage packaging/lysis transcriptional regulator [Bacillus sp. AFS075034]|uniref:ArpU family phage packaging/lysis transcriptional regulator n=1 Tax=Bacillus sp. AFS075034 TaxID=2034281 RepID=UPI000BF865C0|nr:ArpU family phage packaging/lysis transcriptional regulator [Bacillus sp. AFS075034]PFW61532.1 ArpU family transcriptional regulator [Bacillus sp. AFS075034]
MEKQLTLLPDIDDKKVQKEVVGVLKEYRALKMRFNNEVEQEGISLFPELRDSRTMSRFKLRQIEKVLNDILDSDEKQIIEMKFLNNKRLKDEVIYEEIGLYKNAYYAKKRTALRLIATSLGMI